jgi:hypothetical protein
MADITATLDSDFYGTEILEIIQKCLGPEVDRPTAKELYDYIRTLVYIPEEGITGGNPPGPIPGITWGNVARVLGGVGIIAIVAGMGLGSGY